MCASTAIEPDARPIRGVCRVPGDKAISHRAAMVAALASGRSRIGGFSSSQDCARTTHCLIALGVDVDLAGDTLLVGGRAGSFSPPAGDLDCGRSATTMRLLAGMLAAAPFRATLTGHRQLLNRPMSRIAEPLRRMGADVRLAADDRPPVQVGGDRLEGIEYHLPIASGQVKSAVLLAGLGAEGATTVVESMPSRDHLERLLLAATSLLRQDTANGTVRTTIEPTEVRPLDLHVPGDVSSASALLAAVLLIPGSALVVEDVGLNPTRTGFLRVLDRMGARIEIEPSGSADEWEEPRGTISVEHGELARVEVDLEEVPSLIDELPLVGLLGTQADGETIVRGATELRVKESDRISGLVDGLRALGADIEEHLDGFVVRGPTELAGGATDAREDHRLAMVFWLAGLVATGPVQADGLSFVSDSFPGFVDQIRSLQ